MIACCFGIAAFILDSKTALAAAQEGIELCLRTTIPALFPMMVLTTILTSGLIGRKLAFLEPICKLCGIPQGAGSLLLTGLVGGYPVGAMCVSQAYRDGSITKQEARRLLAFCSNAGPAFLFGIAGAAFSDARMAWWLWGIHIASSLLVGMLLPGRRSRRVQLQQRHSKSLQGALSESVSVLGIVCGWIVWMRVISAFLDRWLLWLLPPFLHGLALGMLELVNGCHSLALIPEEGARFILSSAMLSFGGVCVLMQTVTVTKPTGLGMYFPGKVLQCILATLLAFGLQFLLFEKTQQLQDPAWLAAFVCLMFVFLLPYLQKRKKSVAFYGKLVYNE